MKSDPIGTVDACAFSLITIAALAEPAGPEQAAVVGYEHLDLERPAGVVDHRVDPRDLPLEDRAGVRGDEEPDGLPDLDVVGVMLGTLTWSRSGFSITSSAIASPCLSICPSETFRLAMA